MKTAIIRQRVADFLKRYAPFEGLSDQDLLDLAGSGRVRYHQPEEYLFRQRQAKGQFVWMIQQGRVELLDEPASGEQLRDVVGEGDLLGLDRFVGDGSYLYSARTGSDVILYGLAAELFESMVQQYPVMKRFLSAHFSVCGITGVGSTSWLDAELPPLEFFRARLVALPFDASIVEVKSRLRDAGNGVIALVAESHRPAGIVTAVELCSADGGSVGARARPTPPSIAAPLTTRGVIRRMLAEHSEELVVTVGGTPESRLEAVVTASEIALFCGQNPQGLASAIRRSGSTAEIVPLWQQAGRMIQSTLVQPHDADDCCRISFALNVAMAEVSTRLAHVEMVASGREPPETPHCWVLLGASARGDHLGTDLPTIAAVYDDSAESFRPDDEAFFTSLVGQAMARMQACGRSATDFRWPEGVMPSMPISEWKRLYSDTIRNPIGCDLYARREFFDLWPLSGELTIVARLQQHVALELRDNKEMIPLLANDTLAHLPPLTFFRGLVLELDGAQRDSFDIETAALIPLAAAARVFGIATRRPTRTNTLDRLDAAVLDFPQGAAILSEGADAFRIGLYYRALAGGPRICPSNLGKFDQLLLKNAISSIQRLLEFTAATFIP